MTILFVAEKINDKVSKKERWFNITPPNSSQSNLAIQLEMYFQIDDDEDIEVTFDGGSKWYALSQDPLKAKFFKKDYLHKVSFPVKKGDEVDFRAKGDVKVNIARIFIEIIRNS